MKKTTSLIVAIILITSFMLLIMPTKTFATNENIQVVKTNEDYIIYVKDIANKEFKFATASEKLNSESIELNYINSVKDGDGNSVAMINVTESKNAKYLYIKEGTKQSIIELNYDEKNVITQLEIENVEKITNKIKTDVTIIKQRDEQIEQVKHEETIGGLEIKDDADAKYEYVFQKLPETSYSELKKLTEQLNTEYEEKDIYSKIEFVKEYNTLLNSLIKKADDNKDWKTAENMQIKQPNEAQKNDEYVYIIKQTKNEKTKYDVKFLKSNRTDVEPEVKEEKIEVKRTSKLPVTGDSLLLFGILAIIIVAIIFVYTKLKKTKNINKKDRH